MLNPLLNKNNKTMLFVGIGNRLKSDDIVGVYICENLECTTMKKTLTVECGIERYIGKINSISPDVLVFIDSADFNEKPGFSRLFPINDLQDETLHTHTLSVVRLKEFFQMETYVLGIQPEFVGFGEVISPDVRNAAEELITFINSRINPQGSALTAQSDPT